MESRIVLKTGKQEKLYPPTDVSVSQQCRPQLRSVRFEDLVHNIFRNENLTLEINVSHFGVTSFPCIRPCGDSECNEELSIFIFSKNIDNFFYICSVFVAPFSTISFPSHQFWGTIQSQRTYRCTTFDCLNHSTNCWSFPHFSATAMTCSQIFVLLLMQLLSHLKDPPFPEETQKMRFADPATI